MDHPQHYQPLSHALNPPSSSSSYPATFQTRSGLHHEEDEEDEDEDVGAVQQQLQESMGPTSPLGDHSRPPPSTDATDAPKRRPGRPRGSKNRKTRVSTSPVKQETPSATSATSSQFPEVNASNQQYYEFQWRVLNLCAEFYGAAEELVKATPPLVIAQCYQVGPSVKVDPLTLLNSAKAICDSLLQNPTRLISNPPPPMYPPAPLFAHSGVITNPGTFTVSMAPQATAPISSSSTPYNTSTHNAAASSSHNASSHTTAPVSSSSNTNPSSTTTAAAAAAAAAASSYSTFPAYPPHPSTAYPPSTFAYATYQHVPAPAGGSLSGPVGSTSGPITAKPSTSATPTPTPGSIAPHQTQTTQHQSTSSSGHQSTSNTTSSRSGWTDEDTEKLRKLAGKYKNEMGETDWDQVVGGWGGGRSRHQILLQAQQMGLKDSNSTSHANSTPNHNAKPSSSTSRAAKRRRTDPEPSHTQTHARNDSTSSHTTPLLPGPGLGSTGVISPRSANSPAGGHRTTTSSPAITPQEQPTVGRQAMPVSSLISPAGHIYGGGHGQKGHTNTNAHNSSNHTQSQTQSSQSQTQTQTQTQPAPSTSALPTMPWPYPTVAVNTASPVLTPTESSSSNHYNRTGENNYHHRGGNNRDAKGSPSLPGPGQMNHDRPAYHSPYLQHSGTGRRK